MGIQRRFRPAKRKYVRDFSCANMVGLTRTVQPTPIAHPVIPNPFPCARISEGKISVGIKNATVPQVAAYIKLKRNSMVTAAGANDAALEGSWSDPSYTEAAIRLTKKRPSEPPIRQRLRPSLSTI